MRGCGDDKSSTFVCYLSATLVKISYRRFALFATIQCVFGQPRCTSIYATLPRDLAPRRRDSQRLRRTRPLQKTRGRFGQKAIVALSRVEQTKRDSFEHILSRNIFPRKVQQLLVTPLCAMALVTALRCAARSTSASHPQVRTPPATRPSTASPTLAGGAKVPTTNGLPKGAASIFTGPLLTTAYFIPLAPPPAAMPASLPLRQTRLSDTSRAARLPSQP
jgi:hypothetical protein